jgi:hypothetical protein
MKLKKFYLPKIKPESLAQCGRGLMDLLSVFKNSFFMLTFKGILFIIVNDLIRVLYEDKNHRSKNQPETLPLRL